MSDPEKHTDAGSNAGAEEAEVLFSRETVNVGGEAIEVHEFTFAEGLTASVLARPIVAALDAASQSEQRDPQDFDRIIAEHKEAWLELIALNIGKPREWIERLPDSDGLSLSLAFWGANAGFFMKRLVLSRTMADAMAVQARGAALR